MSDRDMTGPEQMAARALTETTDPTAGGRVCNDTPHGAADCGHPENHWPLPAEPDAGDAVACEHGFRPEPGRCPAGCTVATHTRYNVKVEPDVEALAKVLSGASPEFAAKAAENHMDQARRLLASDWLHAVRRKVLREADEDHAEQIRMAVEDTAERIAQAIAAERQRVLGRLSWDDGCRAGLAEAAHIARRTTR